MGWWFDRLPPGARRRLTEARLGPSEVSTVSQLLEEEGEAMALAKQVMSPEDTCSLKELAEGLFEYVAAAKDSKELERKVRGARAPLPSERYMQVVSRERVRREEEEAMHGLELDRREWATEHKKMGSATSKGRSRRRRMLERHEGDPHQRDRIEKDETARWSTELATIIEEADLPRYRFALKCRDPVASMNRCAGMARAKTIRQRVRQWRKVRFWMMFTFGIPFPKKCHQMVDYLEDLVSGNCARTAPSSAVGALAFLEVAGEIPEEERITLTHVLRSSMKSMAVGLEAAAGPTKKAPGYRAMMLASMELYILDEDRALFLRAFAWVKLIKVWASLRSDDLKGLLPAHIKRIKPGMTALLDRSKTSGPGKRVRWLSVFVSEECYIQEKTWLDVGWEIWCSEGFNYDRDYFVPMPTEDLSGTKKVPAEYTDMAALSKKVLGEIMMLERDEDTLGGSWTEGSQQLIDPEALSFWTEHSERNYVNGMAACLGIPKDQRDFLGRWMPDQADDYLRTARAVIGEIQGKVARAIRLGDDRLDESESAISLEKYLESREFIREARKQLEDRLGAWWAHKGGLSLFVGNQQGEPVTEQEYDEDYDIMEKAGTIDVKGNMSRDEWRAQHYDAIKNAEEVGPQEAPFLLSYTRKRKSKTIHLKGGCWRTKNPSRDLKDFENVYEINDIRDAEFCKDCCPEFRKVTELPKGDPGDDSASSSSSTCSDDDEAISEPEEQEGEPARKKKKGP